MSYASKIEIADSCRPYQIASLLAFFCA